MVETAESIKKVLPDVKIWAGGPEVSYDAKRFLKENPAFDGVMIGEVGEHLARWVLRGWDRYAGGAFGRGVSRAGAQRRLIRRVHQSGRASPGAGKIRGL